MHYNKHSEMEPWTCELLRGCVVYSVVGPVDVAWLKQWMEIGWSTMKSLLITSHSLGQSRAILCRTNSTT